MEQRSNDVEVKDAQIKAGVEESARGMKQRSRSSDAAVVDAPTKPLDKESVGSMEQAALFTTRPLLLDQNLRRLPQL